jgi:hypothetical protein
MTDIVWQKLNGLNRKCDYILMSVYILQGNHQCCHVEI